MYLRMNDMYRNIIDSINKLYLKLGKRFHTVVHKQIEPIERKTLDTHLITILE